MADEPMPAEDTEGGDASGGLYDLSSVPEELRPQVEPHLKAMEANATKKFQQHAEELRSWEPYAELGLNEVDPDSIRQLLDFAELAQDETRFAQWWKDTGERMGLFPDDDYEGFDEDELDEITPDAIREQMEEVISEKLAPITESLTQREQQEALARTESFVHEQVNGLREEFGDDIDTDAILQLAYSYAEEDPDDAIWRGFEDYVNLIGKGEANLFAKKSGQPPPPEGSGAASTSPEKITSFDDAKGAALERLRQTANA